MSSSDAFEPESGSASASFTSNCRAFWMRRQTLSVAIPGSRSSGSTEGVTSIGIQTNAPLVLYGTKRRGVTFRNVDAAIDARAASHYQKRGPRFPNEAQSFCKE